MLAADPLCLCWSLEVGAQHQGPLLGPSTIHTGSSTAVVKVLLSSLPLVSLLPADLASRQSSGSPWNSSPSQQVCAELFPFLSHGVCRDNGEMWHLEGALSMGVGLTPSSALLNLPPFQCGSSSASALEVLWAWNSLCSCLDPCAARIRVIL